MGYTTLNKMQRRRIGELGSLNVKVFTLVRISERGIKTIADLERALAHSHPGQALGVDDVELAALRRSLNGGRP